MPYHIDIDTDYQFIEIICKGTMTCDEIYQSREDVLPICNEESIFNLLINQFDAILPDDKERMIKFISTHKTVFPEGTKVAVVVSPQTITLEAVSLIRFIAKETKFSMDLFMSRETALKWLEFGPTVLLY
ncbi:hypothetical protein QUF70_02635 [Desulfobacterales bacterium HSG17]|nr:hypothetical protein [Desulfobacterales bacterium HSG17]